MRDARSVHPRADRFDGLTEWAFEIGEMIVVAH